MVEDKTAKRGLAGLGAGGGDSSDSNSRGRLFRENGACGR